MTKEEIISRVKILDLPKNSYVVFGSGLMAVLGIREAKDIDLFVSQKIYKNLENKGWKKIYKGPNDSPLFYDVFEVHDNWNFSSYNPSLEDLLTRAVVVEDVLFASIHDVRQWKNASYLPKHMNDIKLIDRYMNKNKK